MKDDIFAPRVKNVKQEKTASRPPEYSEWHRTLGKEFLATDIDFVEYRVGRGIVAVIGVTGQMDDENHMVNSRKYIWQRTEVERKIMVTISESLSVPTYYVFHTKGMNMFHVFDLLRSLDKPRRMTIEQFSEFIKTL